MTLDRKICELCLSHLRTVNLSHSPLLVLFKACDMVSATDIITYIGVPLAVLGVTPIFYTFLSALYTRLKLHRILRKNGIWCPIRARLMTGVVEVDLPVYLLAIPFRDQPAYGLPITGIAGASWTCHSFHRSISEQNTVRLQRSDKVMLPAAEISFKSLLDYLLDQGYIPNQEGFRTLRTRRQQTSEGTELMNTNYGRSLCFDKPGIRHGSITMKFSGPLSEEPQYPAHHLPPFHLTGPLLETQCDSATLTNERQNASASANGTRTTTEKRRYFVVNWAGPVGLEISVHETPAPSIGVQLPRDHILSQIHPDNDDSRNGTPWGEPLDWFACAAIVVYGFDLEMPKPFYVFSPDERFLHAAQWYDVKIAVVLLRGLVRPKLQDLNGLLTCVDFDQYDIASANRSGSSLEAQLADRLTKTWITREDLEFIAQLEERRTRSQRMFELQFKEALLVPIAEKHIDMPNLSRMCIQSLLSHPIRLESLSIGSLPQEPSGLDHILQHNADQILRMAILDNEFAKGVRAQIHGLLTDPLASAWEASQANKKFRRKLDEISRIWASGVKCSQEETGLFCCAVVLLVIIGQRGDYLRSGDDMRQCVSDWITVYLS